jgi:hypothetical protein
MGRPPPCAVSALPRIIAKGENARQGIPTGFSVKSARGAMAEVVNLNKIRKAKARVEEDSRAQANRIKHGRTKAEKENDRRAEERSARLHGDKKLEEDE